MSSVGNPLDLRALLLSDSSLTTYLRNKKEEEKEG